MKKVRIKKYFRSLLTGGSVGLVISLIFFSGLFTRLEYITSDFRRHLVAYQNVKPNSDIIFFFIDQNSLNELEKEGIYWPWPREVSAEVIEYLEAGGARAVVFDVLYSEPSVYGESDDQSFSRAAEEFGNLTVAFIFSNEKESQSAPDFSEEDIEKFSVDISWENSEINIDSFSHIEPPIALFRERVKAMGSVNVHSDVDGLYRRSSLLFKYQHHYYPNLALAVLGTLWNIEKVEISGNHLVITEGEQIIHRYPLDKQGQLCLKYYGEMRETYTNYTIASIIKSARFFTSGGFIEMYNEYYNYQGLFNAWTVLQQKLNEISDSLEFDAQSEFDQVNYYLHEIYGFKYDSLSQMLLDINDQTMKSIKNEEYSTLKDAIENFERNYIAPSSFKDKIIFIAGTAPGLYDRRPNPFNQNDGGVHLHATILNNLMSDDYYYEQYSAILIIPLIFLFSILTSLIGSRFKIVQGIIITFLVFISYALTAVIACLFFDLIIDFSAIPVAIILAFLTGTTADYIHESREKKFIKSAFGQYLSTKVINQLITNPEKLRLGGERRVMTAFFSDIEGFTKVSESITPDQLVQLLNEYLSDMCQIITNHDGIVDKFEGDAIIAFWGAPLDQEDHAVRACQTSLEMQQRMVQLRQKWKEQGKHQLKMRIGLNSGPMVVGNLGSNERMDYTIMGDSVNLASRLEGANKFYGTYTMISEYTYQMSKDFFDFRELDTIKVVGKKEPVTIYELLQAKNQIVGLIRQGINQYHSALTAYRSQDFSEAERLFKDVLNYIPGDPPSQVMIERCHFYIDQPPADNWDGSFELQSKG
ncbi:MAG: hypothetical protein APR63_14130 [Desulfuromonas sp. SDB]|nr:MAG: hypothetical protein APR63_14130 [Desulfuromonas sp. SDB]